MRTQTRIFQQSDLVEALAREDEPDMPLPGLVDLRHKGPLLDQTQVLDAAQISKLRSDYEALRGPIVSEPRDEEHTDFSVVLPKPRPMRRVIGALLAVLVGMVSWSVCRSWMAGQHVAKAATPAALPVAVPQEVTPAAPAREFIAQAAPANLPREALDALTSGDREKARRIYVKLARHEREPGPFSAAADILTRELKATD